MSVSSPEHPCLDQLAQFARWEAELATDPDEAESALVKRLSQVPDQRARQGRRHPLVVILALAACATLVVGSDSIAALWQWATRSSQAKLARLGARYDPLIGRYLVPSKRTFRRVLAELDSDALDTATCGFVADITRGTAPAPIVPTTPGPSEQKQRRAARRQLDQTTPVGLLPAAALDGKEVRGAGTPEGKVHLVAAVAHGTRAVLGQAQVSDKRGEGPAARALLARLDIPGMVLTMDALHTTKTTARQVTEDLDAHYVLLLKGNQPLARLAAAELLTGPDTEWTATSATEDDRGHGRRERRSIRTATADASLFPGAAQVFRLRRDSGPLTGSWTSKEIVFGVTSLPPHLAGPAQLGHYERAHWGAVESLHWIRDVTFREDSSQVRTGSAPRALASLRNLAVGTFWLAGRANIAHARRDLLAHDDVFAVYGI